MRPKNDRCVTCNADLNRFEPSYIIWVAAEDCFRRQCVKNYRAETKRLKGDVV